MTTLIAEAARLWVERDVALDAAGLTLADIEALDAALDARLEALHAIDGFDAAFAASSDPGAIFTATWLAATSGDGARVDAVLARAASDFALGRGVESAFGWLDAAVIEPVLDRLIAASAPEPRRVAIAAFAVHRIDPGPALDAHLDAEHTPLRARAVKAAWQLGRRDLLPRLARAYDDPDLACRFSAAWGGALLGRDPKAVDRLRRFAETGERYPDRAVQLVSLCAPASARAWHRTLPLPLPLAILGATALGEAEDVAWLESLPREAAVEEAIGTITGKRGAVPPPGVRHMLGRPVSAPSLYEVLRAGEVRQRALAATELAMLEMGPTFEVREHAGRQRARLAVR
jgi:uncharacterized protein (TIGR02270 family)